MARAFWIRKDVLLKYFNQEKWQLCRGVVLLQQSALTFAKDNDTTSQVFMWTATSLDLAPLYFYLFPKLTELLGGKPVENDDVLQETVTS